MNEDRIAELESLCAAATPPPWLWDDGDPGQVLLSGYEGEPLPGFPMSPTGEGSRVMLDEPGVLTLIGYDDQRLENDMRPADRAFIAASRVAVPELLAELSRLRAELAGERERAAGVVEGFVTEHYSAGSNEPTVSHWGKALAAAIRG